MAKETLKSAIYDYFKVREDGRTAREAEDAVNKDNKYTHKAVTSRVSELVREKKLKKLDAKFKAVGAKKPETQYAPVI
jgi:hypothetical protein